MTNTNPEARDVIADWLVDHDVNPPRGKSINDLASAIIAALAAEGKVIVKKRLDAKEARRISDLFYDTTDEQVVAIYDAALTTTLPPAGDQR